MGTEASEKLFEKNKKAFKKHQPVIYEKLMALEQLVSSPVWENDEAVNIDLGEINLYPKHAGEWTSEQLTAYFENPDRVGFEDPSHCNVSAVSIEVLKDITEYFEQSEIEMLSSYPVVDVGFAFVFGVGLGQHIPELISRGIAKHIILIEPVMEFILHSMHVIDWRKLFKDAKKSGISIYFICGSDPFMNMTEVESIIRVHGGTFIDGSYAYIHYDSWHVQQARIILNEKVKLFYLSGGFFEDEILMMQNTYGNLRKWDFHLVERKPFLHQEYPVFIIGSGSSLDASLPFIKKWRDSCFIFSCGTSLGILLKNGIRPDFHVENENTRPLINNLIEWQEKYGLEGITLVASSTVVPELSGLFDNRWYYYRAALSSSTVFRGDHEPVEGADPLVSNAAFAVMNHLGFHNIYLFGVDCGMLLDGEHHSKDAVYYQDDYDNYVEGESLEFIEEGFDRQVPGNFGGKVMTSSALDLSRRTITHVQQLRRTNLVNCSNGAMIEMAKPMVAPAINLDSQPNQQAAVLQRVENQMRSFQPGEFLEKIDLDEAVEGCDIFLRKFEKSIRKSYEKDEGFWDLDKRIENFWDKNWDDCQAVLKIIGGTYASMVRMAAFGGTRIRDAELRKGYFHFFLDRYLETCLWMAKETKIMLAEMAADQEKLSDVGVTVPKERNWGKGNDDPGSGG